jgi:hypothetical protein
MPTGITQNIKDFLMSRKVEYIFENRFDCLNIKIGIIGSTRRVGTTTAALGLP